MSANTDTIYLKADRNVEVSKPEVALGDVLQVVCANPSMTARIRTIRLLLFHHTDKKRENRTVVSILKVIALIQKIYPSAQIQNLGETDFIVTYEAQRVPHALLCVGKIVGVCFVSFFGAAFSIMTFHNDVDITGLLANVYQFWTGMPSDGCTVLELSYSIGLTVGILIFFNHFGTKRFTVDPTPMEVEMRLYENDIQTTLIETYARKGKELDANQTDTT